MATSPLATTVELAKALGHPDPAIAPLLAAVFSSLEADARIREDAVLGHRVRAMSLLACEELSPLPENAGGPHVDVGRRPATIGASRS